MSLNQPEFEKDVVYLIQFPRWSCSPNLSVYCLKLETWLRIAQIKYEIINNDFRKWSKKGLVPFIELNGVEYDDSVFIIKYLTEYFHKQHMNPQNENQKMESTAMNRILEGSLSWLYIAHRTVDPSPRMFDACKGGMSRVQQTFIPVFNWSFKRGITKRLMAQGYGRHTEQEQDQIACADIEAISKFLGKKQFAFGHELSALDSSLFAILSQFWFIPDSESSVVRRFMENNCQNCLEYLERVKDKLYPDWNQITQKLSIDSHLENKKQS